MAPALQLLAAILLPSALVYSVLTVVRAWRWYGRVRPQRAGRDVSAAQVPIERLGADLRRLHSALDHEENQVRRPAKNVRVRALRAAYLDVLTQASVRFDVPPPCVHVGQRVPWVEIYRVEAALRERGLDVRSAAQPR